MVSAPLIAAPYISWLREWHILHVDVVAGATLRVASISSSRASCHTRRHGRRCGSAAANRFELRPTRGWLDNGGPQIDSDHLPIVAGSSVGVAAQGPTPYLEVNEVELVRS